MQVLNEYKVLIIRLRETVNATILPKIFEGHVFYFDGNKIMINCNSINVDELNSLMKAFRKTKSVRTAGFIYKRGNENCLKEEITAKIFYV